MTPPEEPKLVTHEEAQTMSRKQRLALGKRYGVKIIGTNKPIWKPTNQIQTEQINSN